MNKYAYTFDLVLHEVEQMMSEDPFLDPHEATEEAISLVESIEKISISDPENLSYEIAVHIADRMQKDGIPSFQEVLTVARHRVAEGADEDRAIYDAIDTFPDIPREAEDDLWDRLGDALAEAVETPTSETSAAANLHGASA